MEKEKLKEKYPKIAKKHPRINFRLLDKIISFVKNHPRRNLGISVNDIATGLNIKSPRARNYCLKYAVPFNRLSIHKRGNSHQYPISITSAGDYKPIRNFDLELEESCSLIIDFFNQHPNKLSDKLKRYLQKLKISLANGKPNISAQEKLIEVLWDEGIEINCVTFRRTNYLFC